MAFDTTILGSSAAVTAHGRSLSGQVINIEETLHLVDCGEGTQFQLDKFGVRMARLQQIFISHLHGDHYYGLMGLLTTMSLKGREHDLRIFGPPALGELIALHLKASGSVLGYAIDFQPVDASQHALIYEDAHIQVHTVPLEHKIPCTGFLFKEKAKPRRMIGEKLPAGMPSECIEALKQGRDALWNGRVHAYSELTMPPKPSRSYACLADTRYTESILPHIAGADLLYHEATYGNDKAEKASEYYHSTAAQAASLAKKAGVGQLIISHFSGRYPDLSPLLQEAQAIFPHTCLAQEGNRYSLDWNGEGYAFSIQQP